MWPLKDIRDWKHRDFDEVNPDADAEARKQAKRIEAHLRTDHELQKPPQHFISDVHEEAEREARPHTDMKLSYGEHMIIDAVARLATQNKRMTALQATSTHSSTGANSLLLLLTVVIVLQTFFLIYLTLWPQNPSNGMSTPPNAVSNGDTQIKGAKVNGDDSAKR